MSNKNDEFSYPELSYPSKRDGGLKTAEQWLEGKIEDDGAEGLWRIHDKLYDFSSFMKNHPGGEYWLKCTKGTDITEAFESHHISTMPENLIKKFYIRDASTPRHSPFVFEESGFYRTLKRRVRKELANIPKDHSSARLIDSLTFVMVMLSLAACYASVYQIKIVFAIMAGVFMAWITICAHNFTHQRDNWRMYLFNVLFMPTREWRVTHALSHHMFPNTLLDYEISSYEPIFNWLPKRSKSIFTRYGPRFYAVFMYLIIADSHFIKRAMTFFKTGDFKTYKLEDLVPFILPLIMYFFSKISILEVLLIWALIYHTGSFAFYLIGLNAAHHHPDIFHDGDEPREDRDWGLHQLDAVMDRVDINGNYFMTMTNFGEHALHHLFPTLDHAILPKLHKVLAETCREFNTEAKMTTQLNLFLGQFEQLARNEPKKK